MGPQSTPALSGFAADVRTGLLAEPRKWLPCRYFYDRVGSALFEAISVLPEYGLTRADERLVRAHAAGMIGMLPGPLSVVELGSGSGVKTRWVLEALARREKAFYSPIDVSAAALAACRRELGDLAVVEPLEASYLDGLCRAVVRRGPGRRLLLLFLGSTIGNFAPAEAAEFLRAVRECLSPGDALLLGTDLVKSEAVLLRAYDDPAGVTAAFNLNLLARINRELGGDFSLRRFAHQVRYDRAAQRVEMHLRSRAAQRVRIREAGLEVAFREGETIWTESSHKFRPEQVREMARQGGFECAVQWTDAEWPFAESLLRVPPA